MPDKKILEHAAVVAAEQFADIANFAAVDSIELPADLQNYIKICLECAYHAGILAAAERSLALTALVGGAK